jgi:pyroglutamyl-peptidase
MTIVVTGFEPFAGLDYNPSARVLDLLPNEIAGHEVARFVLPVDSARIAIDLEALPLPGAAAVIHCGLAQDRPVISLERIALNLLDFGDRPDNAGKIERDREIVAGGALALPSRLPVRAVLEAWRRAGIPSIASTSAGTFLCNQCFYLSLARLPKEVPCGFVHLAPDEKLAMRYRSPYQPLAVQAEAIRIAIEVTLEARA